MALNDELLAHHINTLKLAANAAKTVNPYLDEMKQIIRKSVAGFDSDKRTAKRLTTLINTLASQLNKPSGKWRKELEAQLKDFAKYEANYQASTIGGWIDAELTQPTVNQVWAAAQFQPVSIGATKAVELTTLLDTWGVNEVNRLVMGVKLGFTQGLSTNQIIRNVVGAGGLSDISKREAKGVAHDAIMHMANAARFETYAENDDIIIGYELVVTLDGKTSDICAAWPTGKIYKPTDNYQPMPPFHRFCRTTTAPALSPEFDIFDQGATRSSKGADGGKVVSADTTYYGWLADQPFEFQDMRLGRTKGLIFRNAGLTTEEFRKLSVDDLGRGLTIDEMANEDNKVKIYLGKR